MITPSFKLDQNNEFLFINIKTPFVKLKGLDIFIDEADFRFFCKPYFLRLNLPGSILENDEEINYDFEEKTFKLKYKKKNAGEYFEGLSLLTKLLTPNCAPQSLASNLIEEIEDEDIFNEKKYEGDEDQEDEGDEIQWYIDQKISHDDDSDIKLAGPSVYYGFAQTKSNIFSKIGSEYEQVIDLPNPDTNTQDRTKLRVEDENKKFDDDHYLADYFDNSEMLEPVILKYEPYYKLDDPSSFEYTDREIDILKNLPKKKYLLDAQQKFYAYTGLIDILFSYCYNDRINCGEANVESGWGIAKLSSTLSWFETFQSLDQVLISSFRRSLCMPLYRSWKLAEKTLEDLIFILKQDKKLILKCLLEIRRIFIDGDNRYILNDLYINDYCVWIQYASKKKLETIVDCLEKIKLTKEMMDFDIECLEMLAIEQIQNEDTEMSDSESESTSYESSEESESKSDEEDKQVQSGVDQVEADFDLKLNLNSDDKKKSKPLIEILN